MAVLLALLLSHAAFAPGVGPGSEVRLVSADLLTLYAIGAVGADRELAFDRPLPAGLELRLVHFPPAAGDAERAAALAPGNALMAVVQAAGPDLRIAHPEAPEMISLRHFLQEAFGVTLRLSVAP